MIPEREKLLDFLSDEYKILQDKIDKIGGFRFTIKGWSITLVVAALFAGSATSTIPLWLLAGVLLLFIFMFYSVERKQANLSRRFGQRCRKIEHVVSKLLRYSSNGTRLPEFVSLHYAPGIANHLLLTDPTELTNDSSFRTVIKDVDKQFYFAEAIIVIFVALTLYFMPSRRDHPPDREILVQTSNINNESNKVEKSLKARTKMKIPPKASSPKKGDPGCASVHPPATEDPCKPTPPPLTEKN